MKTFYTEEQAKLKLCPFINGSCKASDCMKWTVAEDGWMYLSEFFKPDADPAKSGWESCPPDARGLYRRKTGRPPRGYCGAGS